jgi:hypothetical protein
VYLSAPSTGISYTIDELKVDKADPANANLSLAKSLWTHAEEQLVPDAGTMAFMYHSQNLSEAVSADAERLTGNPRCHIRMVVLHYLCRDWIDYLKMVYLSLQFLVNRIDLLEVHTPRQL